MKAGGTRRLNWTGQQWAQTCPWKRLKTGQYTSTIPPKKVLNWPLSLTARWECWKFVPPPENSCLCSRRTHKYAVCERESVIRGVFVKLIFKYLWVMRVFFANKHLCECVCVCMERERGCFSDTIFHKNIPVLRFCRKFFACFLKWTSTTSRQTRTHTHARARTHTHARAHTYTHRLEKISKTATQWDYV